MAQSLLYTVSVHSGAHGDFLSHEGGLWQDRPILFDALHILSP